MSYMSNGELLTIEPMNLQFPFELKKQISCSLYLTNKTDNNVAFKVKTTNPKNYCVRPNYGLILPKSTCKVLVTMQAHKEAPTDMQSSDKFMIQSVIASPGVTAKEVTHMFSNEPGNLVRETKLRVTYVCFNITNSSSNGELLTIEPMNLQFPFELKKQTSCSIYLTNKTDNNVAFKVKTTNPKNYGVRPNYGLILPKSTCKVLVTMQAQKEAPTDIQSSDKFMIQSVIASPGITAKEVTRNMFSNESGNLVRETKLRVTYVCFNITDSSIYQKITDSSSIKRRFFTKVFCCR